MADQGSDVNIVYPKLVEFMSLTLYPVLKLGTRQLMMFTSDEASIPLTHWTKLNIKVSSLYRQVWAFTALRSFNPLALLLGLPWLKSMDAVIHIRKEAINIEDSGLRESWVSLRSPEVTKRESEALTVPKLKEEVEESSKKSSASDKEEEDNESEEGSSEKKENTEDFH